VDLPIQRERHTNWPHVQASGVKGAFRDWFLRYYERNGPDLPNRGLDAKKLTDKVFGKEETAAAEEETEQKGGKSNGQAGAVSVSDARLLFFPVRSSAAPFVWVTCPLILTRLERDASLCGHALNIPKVDPSSYDEAVLVCGDVKGPVVLEDLAVTVVTSNETPAILSVAKTFAPHVDRLLLLSDQYFTHLVSTATEIQPQIKINPDTGITVDGSLRYEELLPADSVLYSLVFFSAERTEKEGGLMSQVLKGYVCDAISTHIQMGGDMTLGRGLMEVHWLPNGEKGE
jgi:CRISPR-associated protein Cmr4